MLLKITHIVMYLRLFVVIVALLLLSGCTLKVPIHPNVGTIEIKNKLPIDAALLITEEARQFTATRQPESYVGGARPHEFLLGEALSVASLQTFSQLFQKVDIVKTVSEATKYKIYIEPSVDDFHFRYDSLSYVGFAVAVFSRIKIRIILANGEQKIWEKSIESPEQKRGPWGFNMDYEQDVGETVSDALSYSLRHIAEDIAQDPSVRQFIDNQK